MEADLQTSSRRPIRARDTRWAAAIAQKLAQAGLRPNTISVLSVVCAVAAGACLLGANSAVPRVNASLFFGAALLIQLRLLCNLFDGMVAVEGGLRSKSGEIFNELPDRISDAVILVCAGYAGCICNFAPALGWSAGILAVMTAYVRTLGAASGASHQFCGPMAKQQRMAIITIACLLAILETSLGWPPRVFGAALTLIIVGCVITIARRTKFILKELENK